MNVKSPPFVEGKDFRRLTVAEGQGIYRFETLVPMIFRFNECVIPCPTRRSFRVKGREWFHLSPKSATIPARYQWNGSSPKRGYRILGRDVWVGTPDFAGTLAASLLHDAMFQFSACSLLPFSLEEANEFYRQICKQHGFCLTGAYFGALRDFSAPYWGVPEPGVTVKEF